MGLQIEMSLFERWKQFRCKHEYSVNILGGGAASLFVCYKCKHAVFANNAYPKIKTKSRRGK